MLTSDARERGPMRRFKANKDAHAQFRQRFVSGWQIGRFEDSL
jgi:hypothetical protein